MPVWSYTYMMLIYILAYSKSQAVMVSFAITLETNQCNIPNHLSADKVSRN